LDSPEEFAKMVEKFSEEFLKAASFIEAGQIEEARELLESLDFEASLKLSLLNKLTQASN